METGMPNMTGAQALVRQLQSEGIDAVFALPGVQIMAAFDALYEARDDIRLYQTRHEQATTYMADGYARATGKVGVAMVVPGPGALNASAGLATAYATSSPVLLISGQIPSDTLGKEQGHLHEVEDQLDVFKPITKWNHRVTKVEEIPEAVHEAMRQLKTGRPRPVELEVPPDTLAATAQADLIEPEEYPKTRAAEADIQRAARLLAEAKSPAIIAGGGTMIAEASQELLELAEHHPLIGEVRGKGLMIGIELVRDRQTKERADTERDAVVLAAFRRGLVTLGTGRNAIRLSPPLVLTKAQADTALKLLDEAFTEVERVQR